MIKHYNKLIRDRIPGIIIAAGEKPVTRVLKRKEYLFAIIKKISEEAVELNRAANQNDIVGELVDLQELIDVLCSELKLSPARLKELQQLKNQKRGGFKKRLFLIKSLVPPQAVKKKIRMTACWLVNDGKVLLGLKKRGFGAGRWNGFGGKVKPGERIEAAARREVEEEIGIVPNGLSKRGILEFENEGVAEILEVHIFRPLNFIGQPRETDEMKPRWFSFDRIPYNKMWPDDRHWLPLFLAGKKFRGSFRFRNNTIILDQSLKTVKTL